MNENLSKRNPDAELLDRARGCAVGAAVGDALGMPLEFGPMRPATALVRDMMSKRLPAGSFTDDTEMAIALATSLLNHRPLDPDDLADRFLAWYEARPRDIGVYTAGLMSLMARGEPWELATGAMRARDPESQGNGSVMRSWPVALAYWDDLDTLRAESHLQSLVTHHHPACASACVLINEAIYHLLHGAAPADAITWANEAIVRANGGIEYPLNAVVEQAPLWHREDLPNTGWVLDTVESAVWGFLNTNSFEEALVQVVNLGHDADTAGAVVGALAGAAYGLQAIPARWRNKLAGQWPVSSGKMLRAPAFVRLADLLVR